MKRMIFVLMLIASPLWAVEPSEMLADPVLEERARELSKGLRCRVCQNETIDQSNAWLAKELRIVLRERLVAGDSDAEVMEFMEARFGEEVLMRPDAQGINLILWLSAPLLLLIALWVGWTTIRQRNTPVSDLTDAEKDALDKILRS